MGGGQGSQGVEEGAEIVEEGPWWMMAKPER